MLRNLILASLRSISKSRSTAILNILALTLGISACIVAYLHIQHELSYDRFHSNGDQIYRVVVGDVPNGEGWVKVSSPIAPKLKAEIPEVIEYCRLTEFSYNKKVSVKHEEAAFNEQYFYLADPSIFSIFDFEITKGRTDKSKNAIAISEPMAEKYFGNEDPIGKVLEVDSRMKFQVAAVYKQLPPASHFNPDFLISFENLEDAKPGTRINGNWGQFNYFSYLMLDKNADLVTTEFKVKEIVATYGDNQSMKFENLALQPLYAIHFQQNRGNIKPAYDTKYLFIYGAIAIAILAISFINFINLNVASSTRRIKEVGIRKVMGASKAQLTSHFVVESLIITTLATLIALGIVSSGLPIVNDLIGTQIQFSWTDPWMLTGLGVLIASIALFTGLYISLYILSFGPATAVKGVFKIGNRGKRFKEALLTIQFTISCVLILATLFIYNQLNYLQNQDIGLDQEGVLTLQLYDKAAQEKVPVLLPELEKIVGVQHASGSRFTPGSVNWHQTILWDDQLDEVSWNLISIDKHFIETFNIELIEGDVQSIFNISENQTNTYIINEAALRQTGWESALGKVISAFGEDGKSPIAGVAKNFNYKSLHSEVEPVVLYISKNENFSQVSIKYQSNDPLELISQVEATFQRVLPSTPFEYAFAEDQFAELYKVEKQTSSLVGALTIVAVFLALIGVYALLSFTIRERTKEIAIRKVLGIEMRGTILLLSKNYLRLLLLGNLIGIPIAWYSVSIWMNNFSYRADWNIQYFLFAPLISIFLILMVVGVKTRQVEQINPVKSLHYE
ncbi:MAG: ABC transporter permease [Ekhidna sp.]